MQILKKIRNGLVATFCLSAGSLSASELDNDWNLRGAIMPGCENSLHTDVGEAASDPKAQLEATIEYYILSLGCWLNKQQTTGGYESQISLQVSQIQALIRQNMTETPKLMENGVFDENTLNAFNKFLEENSMLWSVYNSEAYGNEGELFDYQSALSNFLSRHFHEETKAIFELFSFGEEGVDHGLSDQKLKKFLIPDLPDCNYGTNIQFTQQDCVREANWVAPANKVTLKI